MSTLQHEPESAPRGLADGDMAIYLNRRTRRTSNALKARDWRSDSSPSVDNCRGGDYLLLSL